MSSIEDYFLAQIATAITDEENRHEVRVRLSVNDEWLDKHPKVLIDNFIHSGRARKWCNENRDKYAHEGGPI